MVAIQHPRFPCIVCVFQQIGQIGYWQSKQMTTSEQSNITITQANSHQNENIKHATFYMQRKKSYLVLLFLF